MLDSAQQMPGFVEIVSLIGAAAGIIGLLMSALTTSGGHPHTRFIGSSVAALSLVLIVGDWAIHHYNHNHHMDGIKQRIGGLLSGNLLSEEQIEEKFPRFDEADVDDALQDLFEDGSLHVSMEPATLTASPNPPSLVRVYSVKQDRPFPK